jgi:hypothetical protein
VLPYSSWIISYFNCCQLKLGILKAQLFRNELFVHKLVLLNRTNDATLSNLIKSEGHNEQAHQGRDYISLRISVFLGISICS